MAKKPSTDHSKKTQEENEKTRVFIITGMVCKAGNSPCQWTRYSPEAMTKTQCEKMLSGKTEAGKSVEEKVTIDNFNCSEVKASLKIRAS
jgi:antisense regulator of RalR protein